eukprot:974966_1
MKPGGLKRAASSWASKADHYKVSRDKPTIDKAIEFRDTHCPRYRSKDGDLRQYSPWTFPQRDFCQFGIGTYLYFSFLQKLCVLFVIMGFLTLPTTIVNSQGKQLTPSFLGFEQLALGNLGSADHSEVVLGSSTVQKKDFSIWLMVSDITYTILFLIYLEFVSKTQTKKADEVEAREITV